MSVLEPFQLLELNVASAQDLAQVSRSMRTYAVAWIHPDRKLSTRVDTRGHNNPNWNDKFVFHVDDEFLRDDESAIMIEIYAIHWLKDVLVGSVCLAVTSLVPPPPRRHQLTHHTPPGMRFGEIQVHRPSGRPQGILSVGLAVLHSSMRSMPLYSQLTESAIGYSQLTGEDPLDDPRHSTAIRSAQPPKPKLRRTKSDCSSMLESELRESEMLGQEEKGTKSKASSMVNGSDEPKHKSKGRSKGSSVLSGAGVGKGNARKSKPSSVISVSEVGTAKEYKRGKPSSILSTSEVGPDDLPRQFRAGKVANSPAWHVKREKPVSRFNPDYCYSTPMRTSQRPTPMHKSLGKFQYGTPMKSMMGKPFMTESELGPSPSEVAAVVARQKVDDNAENSTLSGWSADESVEGLQSKLERWRTELPPVYDKGETTSQTSVSRGARKEKDGGSGLFSCFSNICGCECSIVCGAEKSQKKRGNGKARRSPSMDSLNFK